LWRAGSRRQFRGSPFVCCELPPQFAHCDLGCGGGVQHLPCSALLDLGDVELQQAVEPLHEFLPARACLVSRVPGQRKGSAMVASLGRRRRQRRGGVGRGETNRDSPILTVECAWTGEWREFAAVDGATKMAMDARVVWRRVDDALGGAQLQAAAKANGTFYSSLCQLIIFEINAQNGRRPINQWVRRWGFITGERHPDWPALLPTRNKQEQANLVNRGPQLDPNPRNIRLVKGWG